MPPDLAHLTHSPPNKTKQNFREKVCVAGDKVCFKALCFNVL